MPAWPGDGGYVFAHYPNPPAGSAPIIWLPELSPSTVILESEPRRFERTLSVNLARLGSIVADRADGDDREQVVTDGAVRSTFA